MRSIAGFFALTLCASPAWAGWQAKQKHGGSGPERTSEMSYDHHKLRVDVPDGTSMIIDLPTGDITLVVHAKKQFGTITFDGLIKMRDQMLAQMRQQLTQMPKEMQGQMQKQLDEMDKAMKTDLKLVKTGKKDKVAGYPCELVTWEAPDGNGEACVAGKLPVDIKTFQTDAAALAKKLQAAGAGRGATSLALLQLADSGFPLRTKRTLAMGPNKIEQTEEIVEIKSVSLAADKFAPPKDYEKRAFEELTGAMGPGR